MPWTMGIVEVTCIKLTLVLHRLESLELHVMIVTIFVSPKLNPKYSRGKGTQNLYPYLYF
jgi:hypothetical protein